MCKGKTLVKYKSAEDISQIGYIKAIYTDNPAELIKVVKEVSYIEIDGGFYTYEDCRYAVPETPETLDVVYILVDELV